MELNRAGAMSTGLRLLFRYRAYVMILVVVSLIAWLPSRPAPPGSSQDLTAGGDRTAPGDDATGNGFGDASDGAAVGTDGDTGRRPGASGGNRATSSTVGPGGPGGGGSGRSGGSGAGIGTPEALAAPDCDAGSGRIKISFIFRPACVRPWPAGADNGGVTATGVTGTNIKVVHYASTEAGLRNSRDQVQAQVDRSVHAFSHFYRLWGRKVSVEVVFPSNNDLTNESVQTSDAIAIAAKKPFAVTGVATPVMFRELANRGVLAVGEFAPVDLTLARAPYVWGVGSTPPDLALGINAAEYVGRRLAGRPARWAGDATYHTKTRAFGIVYPEKWETVLGEVKQVLAKYGVTPVSALSYRGGASVDGTTRAREIAARLKADGATSVIVFTDALFLAPLTAQSTGQAFSPEWILTGALGQDQAVFGQTNDQNQWSHAFGVAQWPLLGGLNDPLRADNHFFRWYWGNLDQYSPTFQGMGYFLFGAIHGAGPRLTPQTFRDGAFSLPRAGGAAEGRVMSQQITYGPGIYPWGDDYTATDDYAEVFWDPVAPARVTTGGTQASSVGGYRYLNNGKRTLMGQWPTGEPRMFEDENTVYRFDSYPPSDQPPNYPCTGCPSAR